MRFHHTKLQIVLAACALLGATGAAAVTHAEPFKGVLMGSFTGTPVPPFPPQYIDVLMATRGRATQLGRFTAITLSRVDTSTEPSTAAGTYTFTAANGDTLVADFAGGAVEVAPDLVYIVDDATIVGGTGRFADASGEFVIERLADLVNFTTIGRFQGTISSPGAANR